VADERDDATPSLDHALHDPELIVALLDGDLAASERAPGTALIERCADCARLHSDLLALANATRTQPAPARTRDFWLTEADATRLTGEPLAAATRLSRDMTDPRTVSAHATHDTMLVASLADHSLAPDERATAERLVAGCSLCAALHADLLAIRSATIQLPTPPRGRDFRLTEADAARLRPSGWRRWIATLGSPRDPFTRPLAVGLTTLGIIGILVSGAPLLSFGSATSSGPVPEAAPAAGGAGSGAAVAPPAPSAQSSDSGSPVKIAGEQSSAPAPAAAASAPVSVYPAVPGATYPGFAADQGRTADSAARGATASTGAGLTNEVDPGVAQGSAPIEPASGAPPVIVLSGVLLIAGLGLFLLRWMARRLGS
jgi:hypothetical protein